MDIKKPKKLYLDYETSALLARAWGPKWETNLIKILRYMKIISFSVKWDGGEHITRGLIDYKGYKPGVVDDTAIVKDLHNIVSQADILVAHNGKAYDVKVMNARFLAHKLTPIPPNKVVDTKLEAKKYFYLPSYSLNDIADFLGIGHKLHHEGWPMWEDCENGVEKAWTKMLAYNKHDVVLLEKVYKAMLPWMKSHPNVGMFTDKEVCGKCGSGHIQARGFAVTNTMKYRRYQCQSCGGWGKSTESEPIQKPIVNI